MSTLQGRYYSSCLFADFFRSCIGWPLNHRRPVVTNRQWCACLDSQLLRTPRAAPHNLHRGFNIPDAAENAFSVHLFQDTLMIEF